MFFRWLKIAVRWDKVLACFWPMYLSHHSRVRGSSGWVLRLKMVIFLPHYPWQSVLKNPYNPDFPDPQIPESQKSRFPRSRDPRLSIFIKKYHVWHDRNHKLLSSDDRNLTAHHVWHDKLIATLSSDDSNLVILTYLICLQRSWGSRILQLSEWVSHSTSCSPDLKISRNRFLDYWIRDPVTSIGV